VGPDRGAQQPGMHIHARQPAAGAASRAIRVAR